MDNITKGRLIEKFVECQNDKALAKKELHDLGAKSEALSSLIELDEELCTLLIAGGISTLDGRLLTLNQQTNQLEVKSVVTSYAIKSELTTEQMEAI